MDSDNDSYHSESEFYYPDEENILQETSNAHARFETASVKKSARIFLIK